MVIVTMMVMMIVVVMRMVMPMVVYLRFVFFGFPLGLRPQATDEGQICRCNPYVDWLRKLCPHPSAPCVAATFPLRGSQINYLLLIALTSALMPATIISVWVPQPQVSSPEAHFSPT